MNFGFAFFESFLEVFGEEGEPFGELFEELFVLFGAAETVEDLHEFEGAAELV